MTVRRVADDVESVVAMLSAKHPDIARERIEALVHEVYLGLAARATITAHLIPLTINRCRKRLREGVDVGELASDVAAC